MLSSGKARRSPACNGSSSGSTELARSIGPARDSATRDLAARICSFQSRLARDEFPQRGIENERLLADPVFESLPACGFRGGWPAAPPAGLLASLGLDSLSKQMHCAKQPGQP